MAIAAMRVARPTVDLPRIRMFYEQVVGLPVLGWFDDHAGFDGVIFGVPDMRAQLEIVRTPHGIAPRPTIEDVLVLYHASQDDADELGARLHEAGAPEVPSDDPELNPYWPQNGARTFVDPDGYRLVVAVA